MKSKKQELLLYRTLFCLMWIIFCIFIGLDSKRETGFVIWGLFYITINTFIILLLRKKETDYENLKNRIDDTSDNLSNNHTTLKEKIEYTKQIRLEMKKGGNNASI